MKKMLFLATFLMFSSPAAADILPPHNTWIFLRARPQVSRPTVFLPEPGSEDLISPDAISQDVMVSPDVASSDAGVE